MFKTFGTSETGMEALVALVDNPPHQALASRMFKFYAKSGKQFSKPDSFDTIKREMESLDAGELNTLLRDLHILPQWIGHDAVTAAFKASSFTDADQVQALLALLHAAALTHPDLKPAAHAAIAQAAPAPASPAPAPAHGVASWPRAWLPAPISSLPSGSQCGHCQHRFVVDDRDPFLLACGHAFCHLCTPSFVHPTPHSSATTSLGAPSAGPPGSTRWLQCPICNCVAPFGTWPSEFICLFVVS